MKACLWVGLLLLASNVARADSVDDLVKHEMGQQHIPGMSVAVLVKDKVVKIKGYGIANLELNVPVKPDTVFEIGSNTKQFTATAVMMLVEQEKIGLDDKISKYLPGSPDAWKDITVRNLLNHTSGIKSYTSNPDFITKAALDEPSDSIFKYIAANPLDFPPGSKFEYSNSGYFLLGMIVESVSKEPYARFLSDNIFNPLGMKATSVNDWSTLVPNRACGYTWSEGQWYNAPYVSMAWPFSAGAMMSSIADYAKWAGALYNKKLLKPESYQAMVSPPKLADGSTSRYGFGWVVDSVKGHARIWHNGGIPGFISDVTRWPDDDLTVIVFTNSNCNADEIAAAISGLYIPAVKPPEKE